MRALFVWLTVGFAAAAAVAEPPAWPQFRGPGGSGVAPDSAKPPTELGPNKNVKWKVAIPPGSSSPVVAGDRLFLTGFERGKLFTLAYRRADGAELWRKEAPATKIEPFAKGEGSPAASTPATDGERLVVYFGSYGLVCYDTAGKELWKVELPAGETAHGFGTGSSPVIADGRVVLLRDLERDGRLLCLDLATGARAWEVNRDGYKTSWGSACIWDTPAGKQVAVVGGLRLEGYDLKTGTKVWTVTGLPSQPCTTPVVADGRLIYAGWSYGGSAEDRMPSFDDLLKEAGEEKLGYLTRAGSEKTALKGDFDSADLNKDGKITRDEWDAQIKYRAAGKNVAFALSAGGSGDVTRSHVAWTVTRGLPYIPSPLVYQGLLYTVTKEGLLSAFRVKTGEEVYRGERVGLTGAYASPVAANGYVYLCGLDGSVIVVKAGDEPERVSSAELDDVVYYHSGNKLVYVAHGETVSVLDAKTGAVKARIATGGKTEEFRVDKKANKLFINLRSPSVVAVIDLGKNEVVDRFKLTKTETNGPLAYDDKAGLLFVGCGGTAPMIIAVDAKTGMELASVAIPAGIDNLHYDSKRSRLYASCGDGAVAVVEKKGDRYELIAKVETPKKSKTSAYHSGSSRLYVGVPRVEGTEAPQVLVYEARPVIEAKPAAHDKK